MRKLPLVVAALFLALLAARAKPPSIDPEQAAFAKLSGSELVQQLVDDNKRPRAFYELMRRAEPAKYENFSAFEARHHNSRVVICPQEKSRPPIYLVLYGWTDRSEAPSSARYRVEKVRELFPPPDPKTTAEPEKEPAIQGFTSEGRVVRPFGNYNLLRDQGTLADINGDGMVERVDTQDYGSDFSNARVLTISVVKAKAEPLLTVVLNWGDDEWTYRLNDQDGDGVSEIEAGPRTSAGLIPKAVWKWDMAKRSYAGPTGNEGEHFRVINGAALWKELGRLKAARLTFPKDPDAISKYETRPESTVAPTPSPSPGEPFRFTSLKDASDTELLRFMAHESDRPSEMIARSRLPEDFWTMDSKAAALALVEANRTEKHRAHYQIALDDRDKAEPPPRCTITFSTASARCYNAIDGHYFLRVDPDDSYLAFAGASSGGVVFYNAVHDQPAFDMRICSLRYEEARRIAHVIWWLDRVRSLATKTDDESHSIISTGDGSGHIVMRADGRPIIDHAKTLWGNLPARWDEEYTPETFVNFAGYVIADALPARLGKEWSQFEPAEQRPSELRETSAPAYTEEERKRLREFSERFLGWFSPTQEKISFSIVSIAAQFAGNFGVTSDAARLREIEAALPPPGPPKRSYDEVSAEAGKLPHAFEVKDPKKRKGLEQQRAALDAEIDAILYDHVSDSPHILRQTLALSQRKLAAATDLDRVSALAVSKSDEQQWALQWLGQLERKRYADALETLTRETTGKWTRQFFAELARADRARAAVIARELPAEKIDALSISAFLVLADSGEVPDEARRIGTIIKILHNPKTDWEERARAIEALVPEKNPLRYPGRDIDEALLKLFERQQADESGTFTQEEACLALARRGRTEYFERIIEQLQATKEDAGSYGRILEALTHLAQRDPVRFNPRLVPMVRPHLAHTNKSVLGLIWTIWSADLRELQPDLQRLATNDPDEFEDNRATSYGGVASAVTGRFHLARKILSLWDEPDPVTRAKLLVIFAATEAEELFRNPHPERLARMTAEMNRVADELSDDGKEALRAFAATIDSQPDIVDEGRIVPSMIHKATAFSGEALRL